MSDTEEEELKPYFLAIRNNLSSFYRILDLKYQDFYYYDFNIKLTLIKSDIILYNPLLFNEQDKKLLNILLHKYTDILLTNIKDDTFQEIIKNDDSTLYKLIKKYNDIEPLFIIQKYDEFKHLVNTKKYVIDEINKIYEIYNECNINFEKTVIEKYNELLKNKNINKEQWKEFIRKVIVLYWKYSIVLLDNHIIGIKDLIDEIDNGNIPIIKYIEYVFNDKYILI